MVDDDNDDDDDGDDGISRGEGDRKDTITDVDNDDDNVEKDDFQSSLRTAKKKTKNQSTKTKQRGKLLFHEGGYLR